ncbi:MAG: hypothetical protein J0H98_05505 [Solirubrobacterales bacterium]|nr:hypothetical protein [Solirubrobacterales bacterium]
MKRIKMMLMAAVAVLAIGAVGASAAQAGSGHIATNLGSCDFTFTSGATSSPDVNHSFDHSRDLTNFAPDNSSGKSCEASDFSADLHLHWNNPVAPSTEGYAEVTGPIRITSTIATCTYKGTLTGTYNLAAGVFTLSPSPQTINKFSGNFLCPGSIQVKNPTTLTPW